MRIDASSPFTLTFQNQTITSAALYQLVVGDRADDIVAAQENSVPPVAVTWRYGSREKLEAAGANTLVDSAAALVEYIKHGA